MPVPVRLLASLLDLLRALYSPFIAVIPGENSLSVRILPVLRSCGILTPYPCGIQAPVAPRRGVGKRGLPGCQRAVVGGAGSLTYSRSHAVLPSPNGISGSRRLADASPVGVSLPWAPWIVPGAMSAGRWRWP
jgi:hypothetical protein